MTRKNHNTKGGGLPWLKSLFIGLAALALVNLPADFGQGREGETIRPSPGKATGSAVTEFDDLPVRQPKGAGLFYPKDEKELYAKVDELLGEGKPLNLPDVRAVLVPHAGYIYSGGVAASALRELAKDFNRVFILAANHSSEADFAGVSLPEASAYAIPGAEIPLSPVVDELRKHPLFQNIPAAHSAYMIEVELPFLHALTGRREQPPFAIVPMIAGRMNSDTIQQLAELLNHYANDKTVFVFSVDLSHFFPDQKARQLDSDAIDAILSRNDEGLVRASTDGDHVLRTMVRLAGLQGWDATLLQYKNSGDAGGDRNRVVGYAGIAFHQPVRFSRDQETLLLTLARKTIEQYLETGKPVEPGEEIGAHPILSIPRGVFVTLKKKGQLRGCIGDITSKLPFSKGVMTFAVKAATQDPRFKPVTREELDELDLSISVLEYPRRIKAAEPRQYLSMIKPGQDGVIIYHKGRSSTYLPQVWEQIPDPVQFLSQLCLKQGSPADCWLDPESVLFKYSAYEFGEKGE